TLHEAALHGSSHYDLPAILRWFTANIGVHHVHHLCSRIPYYRLPRALRDHPELRGVSRLTLLQSFRCVRLVLWDEGRRRLISFRELDRCYAGHRNSAADNRQSTLPSAVRYSAALPNRPNRLLSSWRPPNAIPEVKRAGRSRKLR